MKKITSILLVFLMVLGLFTGCMPKQKPSESNPVQNNETGNNNSESTKPSQSPGEETPGSELSTFVNGYTEAKSKVWEGMAKKFEEDQNIAFALGSLGFAFADLAVLDILMFDALTVKDGDSFKGKLMFTDIDAWKKVKGDIIEFGYDFTHKEEDNNSKVGDHQVTNGRLDRKNNALYYEKYTERNNKRISTIVVEIVRNSENSYSSQLITSDSKGEGDEGSSGLNGYLTWFEGEDIISVLAEDDSEDANFVYNTIIDRKNAKPEEMANGMNIVSKSSFIKGVATYEQADDK